MCVTKIWMNTMVIKGCKAWVSYLDKVELPLLAKTLKSISLISDAGDIKIDELVGVILNDADLTSKVLKLANSVIYNPMNAQVSTMSRAIVQVGFESIKAIAISSALVDQLSKKGNQQQLINCLVRSFHAAIQAKYMASDLNVEEQEAIFIAALLFDVGEAAFWSCSANQTCLLENKLSYQGYQYIDDQKEVLGTSFKSISRGLVKAWHLGVLLEESVNRPSSRQARIVCAAVELAHKYDHGWDKSHLSKVIESTAVLTGRSDSQTKADLLRNAAQAAILAEQFGIKGAKSLLKVKLRTKATKPDAQRQLECLLKISEHISTGADLDKIIELTIDSIQKTVGLARCACFIAKPNSRHFRIIESLGLMSQNWRENNSLYLKPGHVILDVLDNNETQCLPKGKVVTSSDMNLVSTAPFSNVINSVIGSININGNCNGFIYADNLNQSEIDQEKISSFRLFIQQLQLAFTMRRAKNTQH